MSLQFLHESIQKALEAEATRLANISIGIRFSPPMTADQYAMAQCQNLATAYGLTQAMQIVLHEYKKLTDPEKPAEEQPQKQQQRPLYG